jgi:hypothetical protein
LPAASLENPTPAETANNKINDKPFDKSLPDAATKKADLNRLATVPVTTASPAVSDLHTERRASDVAAKPATEIPAERPRTDKKNERQEARAKNQEESATGTLKEPPCAALSGTVRRAATGARVMAMPTACGKSSRDNRRVAESSRRYKFAKIAKT